MAVQPAAHDQWQRDRLAALTAEDGWLNLTDRVEIAPGPQRIGTAPDNDVILSAGPAHLGILTATPRTAALTRDGVTQDFVVDGTNPMLRVAGLLLELHTVADQPAIRVRDLALPRRVTLSYYPYDPAWVILARWEALAAPQSQKIEQKGAAPTELPLTHRAHFQHAGQEVTLLATHWKGDRPMLVFRDATAGAETYAASRYLIGEPAGDRITLDFNRAYNPPCAFTDFAICPLPPPQNRLPFAIRAGERKLDR
ncbi:DUF1684 domain-containing protein [bacterium]|nr:DUF1684 domain-containing protein [bacterium]